MSPSPLHFLPLAPRDLLILTALRQQPLHGYGLVKEAERLSEGKVRMDPANLYRALHRLLRDELVVECDGTERDDPRRRSYDLSELGEGVLEEEARRLERLTRVALGGSLLSDPEGRQ